MKIEELAQKYGVNRATLSRKLTAAAVPFAMKNGTDTKGRKIQFKDFKVSDVAPLFKKAAVKK